jgi:hypothetical protein
MSESEIPDDLSLTARLEGLLFVASEPVLASQLANALEVTTTQVERTGRISCQSRAASAASCGTSPVDHCSRDGRTG